MTNANLLPAGPAISPENFSSALPVEPAVKDASPAEDFFGLISRARQDLSQQPNDSLNPSLTAEQSASAELTPTPTSQKTSSSQGTDDSDSTDKSSKQDDSVKGDKTDPNVAATLLAVMAQLGATELAKPLQPLADGKRSVSNGENATACAAPLITDDRAGEKSETSIKPSASETANAKNQSNPSPNSTTSNPDHSAQEAKPSPPGNSAPAANTATSNAKALVWKSQTIEEKEVANRIAGAESPISGAGTTVALKGERMNSGDDKNEIAGRAVQKVPRAERSPADSAESATKPVATSPDAAPVAGKKEAVASALTLDSTVTSVELNATQGRGFENPSSVDRAAAQAERVAQMVTREVVMVRQSGATGLAVSLKLDPHTELFLQLTNQNGQIQALLRCERGNVTGLDSHWGDLQESLARQNVQLLPLENKASVNHTFNSSPAASSASTSFPQSSQRDGRSAPELNEDPILSAPVARSNSVSLKPKTKTLSGQGWESWA